MKGLVEPVEHSHDAEEISLQEVTEDEPWDIMVKLVLV